MFNQIDHDPGAFIVAGAATTTSVQAARDLVVHYSTGGSDTVPAGTVAVLLDGVTHIFDRTTAVWVIYTTPGSGLLYAQLESQLATISGDFAPLIRIMRHWWDWFQPQQPSGAAIKSGAWSGGAFFGYGNAITGGGHYGSLSSQSIQGGGQVSSIPWVISGLGGWYMGATGMFLKFPSLPVSNTTILDMNFGTSGYWRIILTSAGLIRFQVSCTLGGIAVTVDADMTGGIAAPANEFLWITTASATTDCGNGTEPEACWFNGSVTAPGGSGLGSVHVDSGARRSAGHEPTPLSLSATLGIGVTQTGSASNFPNASGWELSKVIVHKDYVFYANPGASIPMPTSDPSAGGTGPTYLCRDILGNVTTTLTDNNGGTYPLSPGPAGLTVVADGPYP